MNGFSTEEDSRDGPPTATPFYGQSCCLIDDGDRCVRPAGNASFSKRIQKSISQKKLKLDIDKSVSGNRGSFTAACFSLAPAAVHRTSPLPLLCCCSSSAIFRGAFYGLLRAAVNSLRQQSSVFLR